MYYPMQDPNGSLDFQQCQMTRSQLRILLVHTWLTHSFSADPAPSNPEKLNCTIDGLDAIALCFVCSLQFQRPTSSFLAVAACVFETRYAFVLLALQNRALRASSGPDDEESMLRFSKAVFLCPLSAANFCISSTLIGLSW